MKVDREKLLD
jgi:hypothetical protein